MSFELANFDNQIYYMNAVRTTSVIAVHDYFNNRTSCGLIKGSYSENTDNNRNSRGAGLQRGNGSPITDVDKSYTEHDTLQNVAIIMPSVRILNLYTLLVNVYVVHHPHCAHK